MANREYSKLLTRPEWKEKRDVILKRDNYTCVKCGSKRMLQVHHLYYSPKTEPWDYPDNALITLCGSCHKRIHRKSVYENMNVLMTFESSGALLLKLNLGETRLLAVLSFRMEFGTGKLVLVPKIRDEICTLLGIKRQSLSNALSGLRIKGALKHDRGEWYINPTFYWRGYLADRKEAIIKYDKL